MSLRYAVRINGCDDYVFDIHERGWFSTYYTIHCRVCPKNPYGTGVSSCHLHSDGTVCVASGKEPTTVEKAKAVAGFWTLGYSKYIRAGTFPNGSTRINV